MEFSSEAAVLAAAACMTNDHRSFKSEFVDIDNRREEDPFRLPVWFVKGLTCVSLWVANHLKIMVTGETQNIRVDFSGIVALSSFCYLGVAYCYWLQLCPGMTTMFGLVTITSLFSDSLYPSSKTWCCLDRSLATFGVLVCPLRAALFYADSPLEQFEICFLSVFSILFLAWSRTSASQDEYVVRHTLWHLVSSSCLAWLAFNAPCRSTLM